MSQIQRVQVSWYDCDCPWHTKLCDEEHKKYANVPVQALEPYVISGTFSR